MRIAVVSDIHSNLQALTAVTDAIREERVDIVVFCGDLVGYGANPNECCEVLRNLAAHSVIGNHDVSALTRDTSWMNPYAAEAVLWTAGVLSGSSKDFLKSLKMEGRFTKAGTTCVMFHGSPHSVTEYLYEEDVNQGMLAKARADVLIFGHTHVPYVRRFGAGIILNPGSVGQPRDGNPKASYAILESEKPHCDIRRVDYDVETAANAILSAGLPGSLAERLFQGR